MPGDLLDNNPSSGPMILLKITWKLIRNSHNISRRIMDLVVINIFPSNISEKMLGYLNTAKNSQLGIF